MPLLLNRKTSFKLVQEEAVRQTLDDGNSAYLPAAQNHPAESFNESTFHDWSDKDETV